MPLQYQIPKTKIQVVAKSPLQVIFSVNVQPGLKLRTVTFSKKSFRTKLKLRS